MGQSYGFPVRRTFFGSSLRSVHLKMNFKVLNMRETAEFWGISRKWLSFASQAVLPIRRLVPDAWLRLDSFSLSPYTAPSQLPGNCQDLP